MSSGTLAVGFRAPGWHWVWEKGRCKPSRGSQTRATQAIADCEHP